MADWTTEVFENEYLPADATDVHAIVTVTCQGAGTAGQSGAAAEVIIVDTSGSMSMPHDKIVSARQAAAAAIDEIVDGTWFAVIAGDNSAHLVYPTAARWSRPAPTPGPRPSWPSNTWIPAAAPRSGAGSPRRPRCSRPSRPTSGTRSC